MEKRCSFLFALFLITLSYSQQKGKLKLLENFDQKVDDGLKELLEEIMLKSVETFKCVAIISDNLYSDLFVISWFKRFKLFLSFIMIHVEEADDLLSPRNTTQDSMLMARNEGCQLYIILISNGIQVTRLLQFGDRYRVLNTRAKYILLFDNRLFDPKLFYIWKRIINVIFIRQYSATKNTAATKKNLPWFEITTVPFPAPITSVLVPRRLDIWESGKFRKNVDLFRDKTNDLRNQTLRIVAFSHLPGTSRSNMSTEGVRSFFKGNSSTGEPVYFSGTEVEILYSVSKAMNFKCEIYEPMNSDVELWGRKLPEGGYTGIIGEMVRTNADIALGDLYYTPYLLDLMDLSVPYNTECLTFLTPEDLTDNSWKTLISPFKSMMWLCVLLCLLCCAIVFFLLARFHEYISRDMTSITNQQQSKLKNNLTLKIMNSDVQKLNSDTKYTLLKEQYQHIKQEGEPIGLYQFTEPVNSLLYTYSMLLLVSLPKLPTGWSLRMFTGWYWLYCLLLVVAYRASMTAILAKPTSRVTIDTLQELLESKLTYGGWGEINRQFFKLSLDPASKTIGEHFEIVNDSDKAVDRVAQASFAFYENTYFLKESLVKRQMRFQESQSNVNLTGNQSQEVRDIVNRDRNLHIMADCVINMPVSIGFQKNSPLKPRFDQFLRNVLEAGLIHKWLNDVMQSVLNMEVQSQKESVKALMNMKKFFGALVALLIGYFISIVILIIEILYFNFRIKSDPRYNKYVKKIMDDNETKKIT